LTKAGAGTLVLTGANSYTGATTISEGILNIRNDAALGSTAAGTTVASGATLQLQNSITVGDEALSLAGTGFNNNGALENVSGENNWSGPITLAADSRVQTESGTILGLAGAITGAGALEKTGPGTLGLTGNNSYGGATTVSGGTLVAGAATAFSANSAFTVN